MKGQTSSTVYQIISKWTWMSTWKSVNGLVLMKRFSTTKALYAKCLIHPFI